MTRLLRGCFYCGVSETGNSRSTNHAIYHEWSADHMEFCSLKCKDIWIENHGPEEERKPQKITGEVKLITGTDWLEVFIIYAMGCVTAYLFLLFLDKFL